MRCTTFSAAADVDSHLPSADWYTLPTINPSGKRLPARCVTTPNWSYIGMCHSIMRNSVSNNARSTT